MAQSILIRDGNVVDGSGDPGRKADVLIEGDLIVAVEPLLAAKLREREAEIRTIDAAGKVVCPGFIDMHAHSDFQTAADGAMAEKVRQGFTTAVIGSCGFSAAPANLRYQRAFQRFAKGIFGPDCRFEWETMGEYLDLLRARGVAANVFPQVGFGNLRTMAKGILPGRPRASQLKMMKELLARALDEGARGFTTGLVYPPQRFASAKEVTELCRVAAEKDVLYSTHLRDEGDHIEAAIEEALQVARDTGLRLQISHHKAIFERNWGKPQKTLAMLETARRQGIEVETDAYPYDAFGNLILRTLFFKEPRLADKIILIDLEHYPEYRGMTLADVMRATRKSFRSVSAMLLRKEGLFGIMIAGRFMAEDDVRTILAHPLTSIGSDGVESFGRPTHPRLYGTATRFLETYVYGEKLVSLEEGIRKMTSKPAAMARISRRGLLKKGHFADVVVFDPKRLQDRADYEHPNEYPLGYDAVIVNGQMTVTRGRQTRARAGRVL